MDRYDEQVEALERDVLRYGALMRAQVPGDPNAQHWQHLATAASEDLRDLQRNVEQLRALDAAVAGAGAALNRSYDELADSGVWPRVAMLTGGLGAGLALLGLVWPRWWVWPTVVILFALAAAAVVVLGRRRRNGLAAVADAQDALRTREWERAEELEMLRLERELLDGGELGVLRPVSVEAAVVEGELVPSPLGVDAGGQRVGEQVANRGVTAALSLGDSEPVGVVRQLKSDLHVTDDATARQR